MHNSSLKKEWEHCVLKKKQSAIIIIKYTHSLKRSIIPGAKLLKLLGKVYLVRMHDYF